MPSRSDHENYQILNKIVKTNKPKLSIVLIILDQFRYDAIHAHCNEMISKPK